MGKIKLGKYITEYSIKNKERKAYPVYSVTNSSGFCTEYFTKDVSSEDKSSYKLVPHGYFAYNPSRINVGSVDCQTKEDVVIVSPLYTVFKVDNNLDVRYLYYFFKSNYCKYLIKSKVSGSVRFNLKFDTLCSFEINEINKEEQQKAVTLFESIENLIETEENELSFLSELIKSRFIELFENQNFSLRAIGEISSFCSRGKSPNYVENSNLLVINQACIYWDELKIENVKYNEDTYEGDRILMRNDILINSTGTGTLGRCNVFNVDDGNRYMADSHVTILRLLGQINPIYFKYWFKSEKTQSCIYSDCVNGSTNQIELSREKLRKVEIPLPPIELQNEFASFVEKVDKLKFSYYS